MIIRDHAVVTQSFNFSFLLAGNVITIKRKKPSDTSSAKQLQYGAWKKHFVRKITELETNSICADVHGCILFKKSLQDGSSALVSLSSLLELPP